MPSANVSIESDLQLHQGADQRLTLLVILQSQDERAVDLQRVNGKPLQVSEG